jgi:hypothetical protein
VAAKKPSSRKKPGKSGKTAGVPPAAPAGLTIGTLLDAGIVGDEPREVMREY